MKNRGSLKATGSAARASMHVSLKIPETMPLQSADILVSQNSLEKGLFYLTFFQSCPPIIEEGVPPPTEIRADCVVRLGLTPQVTLALIQTLQQNFERFQAMLKKQIDKTPGGSK